MTVMFFCINCKLHAFIAKSCFSFVLVRILAAKMCLCVQACEFSVQKVDCNWTQNYLFVMFVGATDIMIMEYKMFS